MDLVSAFLRLARLYPNDEIIHLDNQGESLRFKTTHFEATLIVKAAEELADKFFELKIPRCSVYVGIVRFWLTQRNPKFINLTPFEEWLTVPWPELKPNEGRERLDILTDDRIVNSQQVSDCMAKLSAQGICGSRGAIAHRLSQEGHSTAECWNESIEEQRKSGWTYAEEYSYKNKQAPHIVNFDELPQHVQDTQIEQDQLIDNFGIQLRSKEAVEQEWAKAWITE